MSADEVTLEAGPSIEVSGVDCFASSGWYGVASGLVHIGEPAGMCPVYNNNHPLMQ
jgi:hypothetical protein